MKVKNLKPAPYNPRTITDKQLEMLSKSMPEFGDLSGIVVNVKTGHIIGGHQRVKVFDQDWPIKKRVYTDDQGTVAIGYVETPYGRWGYREVDWDEQKEAGANIAANKQGGEWNLAKLSEAISDFALDELDIDLLGFDDSEFSKLMGGGNLLDDIKDSKPQIDKAEELNKKWQVKEGDLWQIGDHRLLCGDSTKKEVVERVMGGEKADMVFTDPPYGMDLDTDFSNMIGIGVGKKYERVQGDDVDYDPAHIFRDFQKCREIFLWGADYYSERIPKRNAGSWFVWDKMDGGNGVNDDYDKMFGSNFELCWSRTKHKRALVRVLWKGIFGLAKEDTKSHVHPTQKPVGLAVWFLFRFSIEKAVVVDLFLGSGTTMVACQNFNRKCYALEISLDYCAVTLQRMRDAFPDIEIKKIE